MGSVTPSSYAVPEEARRIFEEEILGNSKIPALPEEIHEAAHLVQFAGNDAPSIPINWRFAESIGALKGFEASMVNVLRARKYGCSMSEVTIDTDHASLFFMSPFLTKVVDAKGEMHPLSTSDRAAMASYGFQDADLHRMTASLQRILATNIYRTKDARFYHVHGSMNPDPSLKALGLPADGQTGDSYDYVCQRFQAVVGKYDASTLDTLMNDDYKQAGSICWSTDEFLASEHGKANSHIALYEMEKVGGQQPPAWWPENASMPSSPRRPLAGLKVVDLTRVIAAPTITRSLAELGASVMRVTSSNVTDYSALHPDLNWGKWNCNLDLKKNPEDKAKLAQLIKEADVVVEGYRPGAMARNGFGEQDIFDLVKNRDRGLVFVRENCYGWHGPWKGRSGWQQISDACCGVSLAYGRAMGNDEAVTPVFPNSDYCTGVAGSIAVIHALLRRADEGGSYRIDTSLNYYSQWLINSVGTYPDAVWEEVWRRHGKPLFRHFHAMMHTVPTMVKLLSTNSEKVLFKPEFFERRTSKAVGYDFVVVKPIAQFKDDVHLGYNVGTRSNGVDRAVWPEDLSSEIVV